MSDPTTSPPATGDQPPAPAFVRDLDTVVELGPGRLETEHLDEAVALRQHIAERLARGDAVTVVALAGGTGVGKSALFNRLVGAEVAEEGVRRPTTARPLAAAGRLGAEADALLDWLAVPDRRAVAELPDGLVLIDLPDHDSVHDDHRATAERLCGRVDGLVVVTDPIKYARADLHDGLLSQLVAHAEVTVVVFNRIDELDTAEQEACLGDLRQRLQAEGHGDVEVVATSARTGEGLDELRSFLEGLAADRRAAARRLAGDTSMLARRALGSLPATPEDPPGLDELLAPLLDATDAHRAAADAEVAYRRDARGAVRSPLARIVRAPFSLVGRLARDIVSAKPDAAGERRTEVTARVEAALARELELATATGRGHEALERTIHRTAVDAAPALIHAVRTVPLRPSSRWWWTALAWLRGFAEVALVVGLAWLIAAGVVQWLQLPPLPMPEVDDRLSWPAALFLYGLAARVVLGLATRGFVALGARRHRADVADRVRRGVTATIRDEVTTPFQDEAARRRELRQSLTRLAEESTAYVV